MPDIQSDAILTRASGLNTSLAELLYRDGLTVSEVPLLHPMPDAAGCRRLAQLVQQLGSDDWIAITSPTAARVFSLIVCYRPKCKIASLGQATTNALQEAGMSVSLESEVPTAIDLGHSMVRLGISGRRIVLPRSDLADAEFPALLASAGAMVSSIVTYKMLADLKSADSLVELLQRSDTPPPGAVVLASGSAAQALSDALQRGNVPVEDVLGSRHTGIVTIGPRTSAVALQLGLPVAAEAKEPSDQGLCKAVHQALSRLLIILAVLLACPELTAMPQDPGPFGTTSRAPMRIMRHDPVASSALAGGGNWLSAQLEYSSIFQFETGYQPDPGNTDPHMVQFDSELASLVLSGQGELDILGLPYGLRVGGSIALLQYSAGFMDSFLEDYHNLLSVPNLGKENQPRDRFMMRLRDQSGNLSWEATPGGVRGGNLQGWVLMPVWRDEVSEQWKLGLALRSGLMVPTGSDSAGVGLGKLEWSAGAVASTRWNRWAVDASLDWVSDGEVDFRGVAGFASQAYLKFLLAGRWMWSEDFWLGVQLSGSGAAVDAPTDLRTMTQASWLMTFGGNWRTSNRVWIDFGMSEDMNHAEIDFTAFIRVRVWF